MQNERSDAAIRRSVRKALIQRLRLIAAGNKDDNQERANELIDALQARKYPATSF